MAGRVRISNELIVAAMQSDKVRTALAARADQIATRARAIADDEEVEVTITRKDGTRPKGRPYSRVTSDNVDAEWGTSKTRRSRILGRAAAEGGS